jgi:hypothetical protein
VRNAAARDRERAADRPGLGPRHRRLVNARGDSVDAMYLIHLIGVVANDGFVRRFRSCRRRPTG